MFLTARRFLLWTIGDVLDNTRQFCSKGRPGGIPFPVYFLPLGNCSGESQAIAVRRNVSNVIQAMTEMSYLKLLGLVNKITVLLIVKL